MIKVITVFLEQNSHISLNPQKNLMRLVFSSHHQTTGAQSSEAVYLMLESSCHTWFALGLLAMPCQRVVEGLLCTLCRAGPWKATGE